MTARLIVFDVAGTTVLDGDAVIDAMEAALATQRVPAIRAAITAVMGMPKPAAIRQLLTAANVDPGAIDETGRHVYATFTEFVVWRYRNDPGVRPAPGAEDVFRRLRDAGIRTALDTGFSRQILDVLLERLRWTNDMVDFTVASDEVERGRPAPDLIFRAMELAGIADTRDVAKVGDTPADIEQGLAAHCGLVVGVTYGTHSRGQLARFDVPMIDRLAELLPLVGAS